MTGISSLTTGLSVFDIYNTSIFIPEGSSRGDPHDFFFAGNILDVDTTLPGVRIQGACEPFSDEASIAIEKNITAIEENPDLLSNFCVNHIFPFDPAYPYDAHIRNMSVLPYKLNITFGYCTNAGSYAFTPIGEIPDRNSTAYIFFQTNNETVYTSGVVKCQSVLSMGSALISGSQGIYKSFRNQLSYNNSTTRGETGIMEPLGATLRGLTGEAVSGGDQLMMPSLDIFADRIWLGVSHSTAALGLLFRTSDIAYPAVVRYATSGRTRSGQFVVGSCILLALWMSGLIYVSIRSYRLSTDPSLGSYVAARLHAEDTRLYAGEEPLWDSRSHSGELSSDERLNRPFVLKAGLGDDLDGM
ncbi:hypothetical protein BU17DRAFT_100709 [Hysterangium stoloniferum]|nr:hypothetical protein BU17DRAFT_100709 [Hysterangium stoloniferum]